MNFASDTLNCDVSHYQNVYQNNSLVRDLRQVVVSSRKFPACKKTERSSTSSQNPSLDQRKNNEFTE